MHARTPDLETNWIVVFFVAWDLSSPSKVFVYWIIPVGKSCPERLQIANTNNEHSSRANKLSDGGDFSFLYIYLFIFVGGVRALEGSRGDSSPSFPFITPGPASRVEKYGS